MVVRRVGFKFIELGAESLHARQNQDASSRSKLSSSRRVRRPAVLARVRASCLGSSHKIGTGPQARRGYGATIDAHGLTQYPRQPQEAGVSATRIMGFGVGALHDGHGDSASQAPAEYLSPTSSQGNVRCVAYKCVKLTRCLGLCRSLALFALHTARRY